MQCLRGLTWAHIGLCLVITSASEPRYLRSTVPTSWGEAVNLAVYEVCGNGTRGGLLIVPGFQDPVAIKYPDLLADFAARGFSPVVAYDHRGQGASTRLLRDDLYKGHVDRWTDYLDDFATVVNDVGAPWLACHSMGGAICFDALTSKDIQGVKALVAMAPMVRPVTAPFPFEVAKALGGTIVAAGLGTEYPPTRGAPAAVFWDEAILPTWTSSSRHWTDIVRRSEDSPGLRTGDADATLSLATMTVYQRLTGRPMLRVPTLIQLAGQDVWVNNDATLTYVTNGVRNPTVSWLTDAKHGMWVEREEFRTPVIDAAARWFVDRA